MVSSIPELF